MVYPYMEIVLAMVELIDYLPHFPAENIEAQKSMLLFLAQFVRE